MPEELQIMMDFIRPTSGSIKIFGRDSHLNSVELKNYIGYLSGEVSLYKKWTGQKYINFLWGLMPFKVFILCLKWHFGH